MDLRDLYQDIILDHGQRPRNFRVIDHPTHTGQGHNPLCGDRITVYLDIEGDRIVDAAFKGQGCAISTASSSLMTEVLRGKTLAQAHELFQAFHAEVTAGGEAAPQLSSEELDDDFERLQPLAGVKTYPMRVKCATLSWHAFEAAVKAGAGHPAPAVKTE